MHTVRIITGVNVVCVACIRKRGVSNVGRALGSNKGIAPVKLHIVDAGANRVILKK